VHKNSHAHVTSMIEVGVGVTVKEFTVLHQKWRIGGNWDYAQEIMFATLSVFRTGLPHFQHSATLFLHRYTGTFCSSWICV